MWNRLNRPELTMMNAFSEQIWQMEQRRPGNFPDFDPAQPLLAFSDYGGAHAGARFESFSFLFLQPAALPVCERKGSDLGAWGSLFMPLRWLFLGLSSTSIVRSSVAMGATKK
jgi:hypothetical protein